MQDIPETIQWLLDFVNLASIQGEPNHSRLLPKEQRKLKRSPKPPKYLSSLRPDDFPFIDKNTKYIWRRKANGEIEFEGLFQIPFWRDFKTFFLNHGIPPRNGKDIRKISDDKSLDVWFIWKDFFEFVSDLSANLKRDDLYIEKIRELYLKCLRKDKEKEDYITFIMVDCMEKKLPFPHNNLLPYALYALILDFVLNHKDLHSRLKQCPYCGRFWIAEKRRRRKFCSKECESKVNAPTHYDDLMNKRLARTKKRENDKPKILKHLMKYYSFQRKSGDRWVYPNTKEAEEIYNKISKRSTANYDYFINKWAEPKGYV